MPVVWNIPLVLLSVFVATLGSYTALTHARRMRENSGRTATWWMVAGGSTLGVAIWTMHFVGMLAFHLPVPVGYDLSLTLLSLVPAVIAALWGFRVLRDKKVGLRSILLSGLLMGVGISSMHYLGMAALKMSPDISYDPALFALSVAIAVAASWGALFIMWRDDWIKLDVLPRSILGALVMGLAISAMHYTAMLGLHLAPDAVCRVDALRIEPSLMAILLAMTALMLFGGGLLASLFDQRMGRKNARELAQLERLHMSLLDRSEQEASAMIDALRESEERLSMTLQNAPDAVFLTEKNGHIVYVNDNVLNLLGFSREELCRMTVFDLVPEAYRAAYREAGEQVVSSRKRHVFEVRLISKQGIKIPLELNAVLLPNERIYGSLRDIRERKAAQKALQESQDNLQRMMDSIFEGMYGVDVRGKCNFVNAAFLKILGYEHEDEVLGKHIHTLIHHSLADGQPYPANDCLMYRSFRFNQSAHTDQEVFWRSDGVAVPVEYWSHPIVKAGRVIGAVVTFLDITERREKEQHIHQLAFYDSLTQLPNRRLLMERAQHAQTVSARSGQYCALMLLDLDHFKKLNDTKGHDIGDQLLRDVADRLSNAMRAGDAVARLGGDEFVVVLEGLSCSEQEAATQAELVAEKIRSTLSERYLLNGHQYQSSPSVGVVMFCGHAESTDTLLKHADIAMYQSKHAGRNTVRFYDPAMQALINARIELEAELEQALHLGQLSLHYQIQVDARGSPFGAEVLMRWQHPLHGEIPPAQFIPLAEESGLIVPLGLWALRCACVQLNTWQHSALAGHLTLAVNVSARQFRKADFVEQVRRILQETGARPAQLKIELTESILLENVEETIVKMLELKQLGISFSIDDFGTGYSSLQYLKRLPLDQIKIDQNFVRDIISDPNDAAIVHSIIAMTRALGLHVIAEGVETAEQQDFLDLRGCHSFQGYLFGKPLPVHEFELSLRQKNE